MHFLLSYFFFFNDTATTEIYTLSLPTLFRSSAKRCALSFGHLYVRQREDVKASGADRKSTRLNSSHPSISYAVFCLKKKNASCESSPSPCDHPRVLSVDIYARRNFIAECSHL